MYKDITQKVKNKSIEANDSLNLAKAYSYLADYYGKMFMADSAYKYVNMSGKIYQRLRSKSMIAKSLLSKAILQHNESDYISGEKTVFEALSFLRGIDEPELLYQSYNLLGIIYGELTEYELSEKYYRMALDLSSNNQIPFDFMPRETTLNNIGILYKNQRKYNEAIGYFTTALKTAELRRINPDLFAILTDNLAHSQLLSGRKKNLLEEFNVALKIRDSLNVIPGIINNQVHISENYAKLGDTVKAYKSAKEAYKLATISKEKRETLNTLKQLSKVDPDNALKYSEEYYKIDDSIKIAERKMQNKFARIEFETEELSLEKERLVEQRKSLIYIGLGLLTLGAFGFVIRMQVAKNRELRLIQEQQQANEEVYQLMLNQQNRIEEVRQAEKKRIAQELHDGVLGKLFGTRMNLGVLNSKSDEKAMAERDAYIDQLKSVEQEIREISHDLSAEKAAIFNNFVLMVNHFIEGQRSVCPAAITLHIAEDIDWNSVDSTAKINLYRILQEAFQNINKHAQATAVSVRFFKTADNLTLEVADNGVGFNYARKKKGIGLINMSNRITNSRGQMEIETQPGAGTILKFVLPLSNT